MKVSIIIPVYNVEDYLDECVLSVLNQTYKKIEVVLINDGSTDASSSICNALAKKDNRVTVIHKQNAGQSSARNVGINAANGEIICFLDSDDYFLHDSVLENLVNIFQTQKVEVIEFGYRKVQSSKEYIAETIFETAMYNLNANPTELCKGIKGGAIQACAWNKAIASTLFKNGNLRFKEGVTSEDIDWVLRLLKKTNLYMTISDASVAYRMRSSSTTHTMNGQKFNFLIENLKHSERLSEEEYAKDYMCIQTANMLLNYAMIKRKERVKHKEKVIYFLHYLERKVNRRCTLINYTNKLLGLDITIELLNIIISLKDRIPSLNKI